MVTKIQCIESYIDKEKNFYGSFLIEPLETGHGITVGNALRRTILSDLTSFAITGVRINDVKHEFSTIKGIKDDIVEILSNLKDIVFTSISANHFSNFERYKGFIKITGPCVVTGGMFFLPKNILKISNPEQYICTITNNSKIYLEIDIENGNGYRLSEENQETLDYNNFLNQPNTLYIDSIFSPIKNVNYKVKLIHDTQGNLKESLTFEILTNGSITPERSLQEGIKNILSLFAPLLLNTNFDQISNCLKSKSL